MKRLLIIVEGAGDVRAVPLLVRRILEARGVYDVTLRPTQRRGEFPSVAKHFDTFFLAAIKENSPILWVMDFDSKGYDCPYTEADRLLSRAQELHPDWPVKIAFIIKEFECLFLHDEQATRTIFADIPQNAEFPKYPEKIRGAKERLSEMRPRGKAYKETVHQERITARLNLDLLRERSRDFAHMERAILHLIESQIP